MAGRMLPPVMATLAASDEDFKRTLDDADARMVVTAGLMDDLGKNRNINMSTSGWSLASTGEDLRNLGADADTAAKDIDKIKPATDGAGGGLDNLKKKANDASGSLGGGASGGGGGLLAVVGALAPAILPITGVATGAGIALAGMATAGISGIAAFALAAGPQLTTMKTEMGGLLDSFQAVSSPEVLPVLNGAVGLFRSALQSAIPLVGATSTALLGFEADTRATFASPGWHNWTTWLAAEAGPAIHTFDLTLGNLGNGFSNVLQAFSPVITQMESGLVHLSQGFYNWTTSTGGLHSFVTWFQTEAPQVGHLIENLARLVGLMLPAFGGWGQILITVANPLVSILDDLLRINPVIGEVAAALILGGVAWSKWGDGIKTGLNAIGPFATKANIAITSLLGLGDSGAAAATGVAGAAGASAGLVIGLSALALLAVPLAATFAGMAIGSSINKHYTDELNASVARMTATMSGAAATTVPQMTQALAANRSLIADLTNKQNGAGAATEGLTLKQQEAVAVYTQAGVAGHAYVGAIQKITAENHTLTAEIRTQNSNLDLLSSKFGVTKDQATQLASTLGLNLNKQLTGLQVTQVGAELVQMSQSAGISQMALQNLATTAKLSMSAVSTSITNAESATQKSFTTAGDAVTAFSGKTAVTGQEIQLFYGSAVAQAQTFTANVQQAIQDGYNPTLISQMLEAGPAQAGPLLQSLVDNAANGMVQTVNAATSALNTLNVQAVQQQRITYEAVTAGSSQMAADVGNAFAIQQQMTAQGAGATAASVAQALNLGLGTVQHISDEYSLGLPNAYQQQQSNAYLQAQAQAQQGANALASILPTTQFWATAHSTAVPNGFFAHIGDAFSNAQAQGAAVGGGLNSASGGVFGAASSLAAGAFRDLSIGDTTGIGAAAAAGLAAGLNAGAGAVATAASQIAASVSNTINGALHVKSPSRVTMAIGQFVGQGLAIGIQSTIPMVGAASASMAAAVAAGLSGSGGSFGRPSLPNAILGASQVGPGGLIPASGIPANGGSTIVNVNVGEINVPGMTDPRKAALIIRDELLKYSRTVPGLGLS